jgi:hypothetical protein
VATAPRFAVVVGLAVDLNQPGIHLGWESIEHCIKVGWAANVLMEKGYTVRIVFAAGKSPDTLNFPIQPFPMAELMKQMTLYQLRVTPHIRIPDTLAWGTREELQAAREEQLEWERMSDWDIELHVVASWYHAPRVRWLLSRLGVKNPHLHLTRGSIRNALVELVKFPAEVVRSITKNTKS